MLKLEAPTHVRLHSLTYRHQSRRTTPRFPPLYLPIQLNLRSLLQHCNIACSSATTIPTLTHPYDECETSPFPSHPTCPHSTISPSYILIAALHIILPTDVQEKRLHEALIYPPWQLMPHYLHLPVPSPQCDEYDYVRKPIISKRAFWCIRTLEHEEV